MLVGTVALAIATAVSCGKAEDDDDGSQKIVPGNAGEEEPGNPGKEKGKEGDEKRVKEDVEEKGTNTQVKDEAVVEEKNEKFSKEEEEAVVQVDEEDDIPEKKKKKKVGSTRDYTNIPQSEKEMFGSKSLRCLVCRALVEEFNYAVTSVDPKKKVETGGYRLNAKGEREVKVVRNHHYMTSFPFRSDFFVSKIPYARSEGHLNDVLDSVCKQFEEYAQAKEKKNGEPTIIRWVAPKRTVRTFALQPCDYHIGSFRGTAG